MVYLSTLYDCVPHLFRLSGLYCIIFVLYIRIHRSKKSEDRNILIYPISLLFVLCTVYFALDVTQEYMTVVSKIIILTYP